MMLAQKPDIVFLTGDFVSGRHADRWIDSCVEALAPLTAVPGGAYGVLGNHDWWCGGRRWIPRKLEAAGVHILKNASAPFPGVPGCHIVGVDDPLCGGAQPERAVRGVPPGDIKILLAHEPDYADQLGPGFALQISGHSHGGQIRVPGLPPIQTPVMGRRYPEGLQQAKNHRVYTSRGIGTIGPPYRLFCPPEVTILKITSGSETA
ncbi:hypothetical protein CCAX7_58560 [Capsulimonas corticalis]|uniref:Calcineurin-like phosphoesterase domain-containing protein n=2 Tax=Capsulimonas corticalis TaxID=2219043 RepID=A0A9N7QG31_9BACT|nr:hypothetical protein CCAX7_58560 [Capsulimonas corticalis]